MIGVAAVLAAAVGLAAPVTSISERVDLHDRYEPPFDLSETVSPLSQLRAGLDDHEGEPLLTVEFPQLPDGVEIDHLDTAVLTTYDGIVWGTDATFGRAGRQLPADPSLAEGAVARSRSDTSSPTTGVPSSRSSAALRRSRAEDLGFDRDTGMLVGTPGSGVPRRYDVTSLLPPDGDDASAAAPAGADPDLIALTAQPPSGWPAELVQLAAELPTTASPYEDFLALETDMRSNRYGYNEKARPGHSLNVLVDFLTASTGGSGVESARIGYAEQFASAFAVLARIKGYPVAASSSDTASTPHWQRPGNRSKCGRTTSPRGQRCTCTAPDGSASTRPTRCLASPTSRSLLRRHPTGRRPSQRMRRWTRPFR